MRDVRTPQRTVYPTDCGLQSISLRSCRSHAAALRRRAHELAVLHIARAACRQVDETVELLECPSPQLGFVERRLGIGLQWLHARLKFVSLSLGFRKRGLQFVEVVTGGVVQYGDRCLNLAVQQIEVPLTPLPARFVLRGLSTARTQVLMARFHEPQSIHLPSACHRRTCGRVPLVRTCISPMR